MKMLWSAALGAAVIALSGCATTWRVENEVQTFSSLPATAGTPVATPVPVAPAPGASAAAPAPAPAPAPLPTYTFRFDRLPSQQANPAEQAAQAQLEALALPALNQVGLVQDEAHARYNLQVSARLQQVLQSGYWNDPYRGWWWPRTSIYYARGGGGAWWPYHGGGFYGYGLYSGWDDRAFQREVSVILRDAASGQVVYETRASNFGRWPVDRDILPVMFSAALSGFPQPPAGLRRVTIDVKR